MQKKYYMMMRCTQVGTLCLFVFAALNFHNLLVSWIEEPQGHAASSNKHGETTDLWFHSLSAVLLTDRGTIFSRATLMHHAKPSTIQLHIQPIQKDSYKYRGWNPVGHAHWLRARISALSSPRFIFWCQSINKNIATVCSAVWMYASICQGVKRIYVLPIPFDFS